VAKISAANMTLKLGDVAAAVDEYDRILKELDLTVAHRQAVEKKKEEAQALRE